MIDEAGEAELMTTLLCCLSYAELGETVDNYNKLQDYITAYDLPVLLHHKFKYGISQEVMWGTDREGNEWQAVEDGVYFKFGKLDKNKWIIPERTTMSREQFDNTFGASNAYH